MKKFCGNCLNCGRSDHWSWDCPEFGNRDHHGHCTQEGRGSPSGYRKHERNGMSTLQFMRFVQVQL